MSAALICIMTAAVDANPILTDLWGLHYAGPHNSKVNTCGFSMENCNTAPYGETVVHAPPGPLRCDIYVIAMIMHMPVAGTRYGLSCDGPFFFYGWSKCSDFQIPTPGWPGHGEGNAQTWTAEQPGNHDNVTIGILDIYTYGGISELCICSDPRVGFAEWCDGASPSPNCYQYTSHFRFGCVSFGATGYNPCETTPVRETTWGAVKAIFR